MSKDWNDKDPALLAMDAVLEKLSDHFDNIQIFCNRLDPDGSAHTQRLIMGKGNMYARLGQVRDWLIMDEEKSREEARIKYRQELEE